MKKVILASVAAILGTTAHAEQAFHYDYATVLEATPVVKIVQRTDYERECKPKVIRYERRARDGSALVGTILGAAVGHALGSRSKHRTGVTIAGALVGKEIGKSNSRVVTNERVEQHCDMIPVTWDEEQVVGYNVVYRYNDRTFESRLPYQPGDTLKIRVLLTPIATEVDNP